MNDTNYEGSHFAGFSITCASCLQFPSIFANNLFSQIISQNIRWASFVGAFGHLKNATQRNLAAAAL
jgi:hypothetical protein